MRQPSDSTALSRHNYGGRLTEHHTRLCHVAPFDVILGSSAWLRPGGHRQGIACI